MSYFRILKTVTQKLTSAVAQLWWSSGGNGRGMHHQSLDKLCQHKDYGGLGYKELTNFNTTMLRRQFWRLIEKLTTLFSRVGISRMHLLWNILDRTHPLMDVTILYHLDLWLAND